MKGFPCENEWAWESGLVKSRNLEVWKLRPDNTLSKAKFVTSPPHLPNGKNFKDCSNQSPSWALPSILLHHQCPLWWIYEVWRVHHNEEWTQLHAQRSWQHIAAGLLYCHFHLLWPTQSPEANCHPHFQQQNYHWSTCEHRPLLPTRISHPNYVIIHFLRICPPWLPRQRCQEMRLPTLQDCWLPSSRHSPNEKIVGHLADWNCHNQTIGKPSSLRFVRTYVTSSQIIIQNI